MIIRTAFSCFLYFSFLTGFIPAEAQHFRFAHFSVKEGISQSEIKCIFQDSEGFIWVGTQNGLNKFDGYNFEKYFHDPADTNSLSNNWIFCITEDAYGAIWIGTKGGLNRYDKRSGHFAHINHLLPGTPVGDIFVYGLIADSSLLYINTPPALSILNVKTGKLETFNNLHAYDGILYDIGYPVLRDNNGMIWLGTANGLCYFDPVKKTFHNFSHDDNDPRSIRHNHITALYKDKSGNILIGTADGLNLYKGEGNGFSHWYHDSTKMNSLSNSFIRSIAQDHTGAYWIGTEEGGLNKMVLNRPGGSASFTHFRCLPGNSNTISHDIVYALYEDKSYNLWIGTIAGMDRLDLKKKKFRHYKKTEDPGSVNLLDNVIGSIYKHVDGKLWIGNWNKGLNVYDRNTGEVTHFTSSSHGSRYLPGNNVHVIFRDSKSRIWMGTRNGVYLYLTETGRFIPFQDFFHIRVPDYFERNRVYCILETSEGNIWIGTGNGIFILDTRKGTFRIIQSGSTGINLSSNLVYSLLEDRSGQLWIATSNGLDKFVAGENSISHYLHIPGSKNTLCDNYTISLCEDRNGDLWIGTTSGLNRYNMTDSVFTLYTMNEGLPSNIIYDIVEDDHHNLWFTTGNGLARYNPASGDIRAYTLEEGVQGMEFNIKATFKGDDGELFFGGMDGFISFFPDSLKDNGYIPPIIITSFEKENRGVRSKMSVYTNEIKLTYRDYSFTIEFSALDFTDPSKNQYAFQLEPLSEKWIELGNRRFVHFTNLPPGKYHFRVKGTNNDGFWNEDGTGITILITPPWWKSRYAMVGYLLLIALLIFLFIKWRERRLVAEKLMLEKKIEERTEEIVRHEEKLKELNATKDKFFSIMAHDLKGPFSSLYSMSALLSTNYDMLDEPERRTGLSKIQQQGELIFRLIENLLTWSRSQRGGLVFSPVQLNLTKLVEVNVNLHKVGAIQKGIALRSQVEKDIYAYGDMEMTNAVVRNLISNAVKFTQAGRSVEVDVLELNEYLQITVKDQGVGISAENMEKLFRIDVKYKTTGTAGETGTGLGLVLCREFVELNGGKIWCESQENVGTAFHFTIPSIRNSQ